MLHFAKNLKSLRQERNLSQAQLAKAIGVTHGIISCWENNIYEPKASYIVLLANFFNISIDDLLTKALD